ncbi:MAG TPA: hypothetical protein VF411_05020 [Bacteroidia bacterium]
MSELNYYMPDADDKKLSWYQNFKNKLVGYAAALGLTTAQTNQVNADDTNYVAIMGYVAAIKAYYKTVVKYKNEIKSGKANNTTLAALAPPPALPTFSTPIVGDVFGRVALLVKSIKANPAYTANTHIGSDLKIIGADPNPTPAGGSTNATQRTAELKPLLKIKLNKGGRPWIKWVKGQTDSLYILVDRNDGKGFVLLVVATHHSYVDKFTLPLSGATIQWKYKAIYQDKNEDEEGAWSEVATCTVTGV